MSTTETTTGRSPASGADLGRAPARGEARTAHRDLRDDDREPLRARTERGERMSRALGWLSVGLGIAEIAAPRTIRRAIGLGGAPLPGSLIRRLGDDFRDGGLRQAAHRLRSGSEEAGWSRSPTDTDTTLRLFGLRELVTGLGILSKRDSTGYLWGRVAGDLLDLAFLTSHPGKRHPLRLATATAAVAGVTVLDVVSAVRSQARHTPSRTPELDGSIRIVESIAVHRDPAECYAFWRDLEHLPRVMSHLREVRITGPRTSHWVADAPAGTEVEWDAEITQDEPGSLIVWQSVAGSGIENEGSIRFAPGPKGRGTLVRVSLRYQPPGRAFGAFVAQLFGEEPEQQLRGDLRRFKQMLETGDVLTTEGQPRGPRRGLAISRLLASASRREDGEASREPDGGTRSEREGALS